MINLSKLYIIFFCFFISLGINAQSHQYWHDSIRKIHYAPKGKSFELKNGHRKFNRALYGTHTGFRVETGDLPEFAMYMPGMGGNFKLGISSLGKETSKWLTECDSIKTTYTPGIMSYQITDPLLKQGKIHLQVVALPESEGFMLRLTSENIPETVDIIWVYGGASGKKFHRDGDIGADPESVFYLQPEYCANNEYSIKGNSFTVKYGSRNNKSITGQFPASEVKIASASHQDSPLSIFQSEENSFPVITGKIKSPKKSVFWKFENTATMSKAASPAASFEKGIKKAQKTAAILTVATPDPYINPLGGALATAGDAIWESPAFLHGSIAWRMHLNAWRGAYVADPLGWHDRAELHFTSYANSQVTDPPSGPVVPDTARNFARQKEKIGTAMFSRGYISRHPNNNTVAHHYDMNSVFFNQVLRHYLWTGNEEFIKNIWPAIERHLAWEKRNFDTDNNYLYDAYACIWASDALQYSGGSVSYASAYNYSANKLAAAIAQKNNLTIPDHLNYQQEAHRIKKALNTALWISNKGIYAEYKDLLGKQLTHNKPGIWSIYHTIDEGVPDNFKAYQMLRYIDTEIPHIPIRAKGLPQNDLQLIATTNWQPYTWSVNNVALAEVLHTSLAYWQGQRPEKAFKLWQSGIIESMYLGASPGGFQQLSFYDAMRGELYRDFADPIGMAARSLVEGLYGIKPNAISDTLTLQPGFPESWDKASIKIPDIHYSYASKGDKSIFHIKPLFPKKMTLKLIVNAEKDAIGQIKINNKKITTWYVDETAIVSPKVIITDTYKTDYNIEIIWKGSDIEKLTFPENYTKNSAFKIANKAVKFLKSYDPQSVLKAHQISKHGFLAEFNNDLGHKTFFIQLQQGDFTWWQPIDVKLLPEIELAQTSSTKKGTTLTLKNNSDKAFDITYSVNHYKRKISITNDLNINIAESALVPGTNILQINAQGNHSMYVQNFQNWNIQAPDRSKFETIDLQDRFNGKVTHIFKQAYVSPRPTSPTLQLPTQGIGNWCYPFIAPEINDSGLKQVAQRNNGNLFYNNIPFKIAPENTNDIVFTSQWDNFPESVQLKLSGKAKHLYLLMAGTTNPMQSHFQNGEIIVHYQDGSQTNLSLRNPENWWPIEQDYYTDGYAFTTNAPKPPRVHLKTGKVFLDFKDYTTIKGFTDYAIDGGSATILDLPLNPEKKLKNIELKTTANDVIIGIMSITLLK
ncbi:DUF4450 domain-containing protein [Galbibacter sp. PAP.153]|uniref:DUF4450 domain-containing protein n=1 Tax=Galbibacter sp. PAP.153 TaxID=3104623 RepID=UPI003007F8BA